VKYAHHPTGFKNCWFGLEGNRCAWTAEYFAKENRIRVYPMRMAQPDAWALAYLVFARQLGLAAREAELARPIGEEHTILDNHYIGDGVHEMVSDIDRGM